MTAPVSFRDIVLMSSPELGLAVICRRCVGADGDVVGSGDVLNMWELVRAVAAHIQEMHNG